MTPHEEKGAANGRERPAFLAASSDSQTSSCGEARLDPVLLRRRASTSTAPPSASRPYRPLSSRRADRERGPVQRVPE